MVTVFVGALIRSEAPRASGLPLAPSVASENDVLNTHAVGVGD